METRHAFIVEQTGDTHIVASINGIPIHDGATPPETTRAPTRPADHWLSPGENTLTLDVRRGTLGPATSVNATVWDGIADARLAEIHWPQDFPVDPKDKVHGASPLGAVTKRFSIPDDHTRPVYMDAPVHDVPIHGSSEAWAPIRAFHEAFVRGDKDGVLEGLSLRASEWHRYYEAEISKPEVVRKLVDDSVPGTYNMMPLDQALTRFEPCAGGRMYKVSRTDGRPLIYGKCTTGDVKPCTLDAPFIVWNDNRYRIFF